MKFKASCFSISLPLIKENMRRFWAIPVISFLVYFLSGVFPILMTYNHINDIADYIDMSLTNQQPFYMMAHLLVPVIAAVVLYRYLQSSGSAAVMHALPFTRAKLFNSNFLSGLLMCTVPIQLNGIILLIISKPVYEQWYEDDMLTSTTIDLFTRGAVLNWIGVSLLTVIVLYSISVFTGIVTGNMFIHMLASYFFIFVVTALYGVLYMYFEMYLYGFSASGQFETICLAISPYTQILATEGYFTLIPVLYYVGTFIAMYVLAAVLYSKRKLERASDSLVFDFMKPIICYIIAFLGMTLFGAYFFALGDQSFAYMYAGFAAGAVIFFIIGQMIIQKTPRVFHLASLKSFGIYAVISVLFIASVNFDLTGFENRTPAPETITNATYDGGFGNDLTNGGFGDYTLQDPENLAALAAFHSSILENRTRFEELAENNAYYLRNFTVDYNLSGLLNMSREYEIDYAFYAGSAEMKQIFESLEFKSTHSLYGLGADKFTEIDFYTEQNMDDTPVITKNAEIDELITCLEKDIRALTFEESVSLKRLYASADISYLYTDETLIGAKPETRSLSLDIPYSFTNTIGWLTAHGYDLSFDADRIDYIDVFEVPKSTDDTAEAVVYDTYSNATKEGIEREPLMRITDKVLIQKVLDSYDRDQIDEENTYSVNICYRPQGTSYQGAEPEFIYGYLNDGIDFLK